MIGFSAPLPPQVRKTRSLTMNLLFFLFSTCMGFIHTQLERKSPRHWAPVCNSLPFSPETSPRPFLRILQDNVEISPAHNLEEMKGSPPRSSCSWWCEGLREGLLTLGSKHIGPERGCIQQGDGSKALVGGSGQHHGGS